MKILLVITLAAALTLVAYIFAYAFVRAPSRLETEQMLRSVPTDIATHYTNFRFVVRVPLGITSLGVRAPKLVCVCGAACALLSLVLLLFSTDWLTQK